MISKPGIPTREPFPFDHCTHWDHRTQSHLLGRRKPSRYSLRFESDISPYDREFRPARFSVPFDKRTEGTDHEEKRILKDFRWFARSRQKLKRFKGQYVAIVDKTIISGSTVNEVLQKARILSSRAPLISYIPSGDLALEAKA